MKKLGFLLTISLAVSLACVSCQREYGLDELKPIGDKVSFVVGGSEGESFKSSYAGDEQKIESVVLKADALEATYSLNATVSRLTDGPEVLDMMLTKGQEIDSENITTLRDGDKGTEGKLCITALSAEDGSEYIPSSDLRFSGQWKTEKQVSIWDVYDSEGVKQEYFWPSYKLSFFAWSYSPDYGVLDQQVFDGKKGIMSFHYAMPAPAEEAATARDAVNQRDVMFASTMTSRTDNNEVRLTFDHILSAIKFEVGKTEAMVVKSITLENVLSVGTCSYDPTDPVKPVDWTEVGTAAKYVQNYTEEEGTIHEDMSYSPSGGHDPQKIGSATTTFMVIPQASGDDGNDPIKLTMVFEKNGVETTITADLTKEQATWHPGYEYKYTFTMADTGDLDIQIREEFDGVVKSNVKVENTGGQPAYVRMAIIANWVDGLGRIIRPCDWMSTGTIEGMNWDTGDKWVLGSDGWFYYTYGVKPGPGVFTEEIFESYDPGLPQFPGTKLVMEVMAQGVEYDALKAKVTEAWGEDAAALLSDELDEN